MAGVLRGSPPVLSSPFVLLGQYYIYFSMKIQEYFFYDGTLANAVKSSCHPYHTSLSSNTIPLQPPPLSPNQIMFFLNGLLLLNNLTIFKNCPLALQKNLFKRR